MMIDQQPRGCDDDGMSLIKVQMGAFKKRNAFAYVVDYGRNAGGVLLALTGNRTSLEDENAVLKSAPTQSLQ